MIRAALRVAPVSMAAGLEKAQSKDTIFALLASFDRSDATIDDCLTAVDLPGLAA